MGAHRIPARDIHVTADALSKALVAMGGDANPKRNPTWRVALALAECRRRVDPAPWNAPAITTDASSVRPMWRPPRSLRPVVVSGKDRATGETD